MISVDSPLTRTSGSNMIFSCDRIIDAERGCMTYKVNDVYNIGSENKAAQMMTHGIDGEVRPASIGHKGQEGSDPNYPDSADHVATVTAVEPVEGGSRISRRCTCGLVWSWTEKSEG